MRRLNEAIIFTNLDLENQVAETEFRLAFKRRMYKQVLKSMSQEQCGGKSSISNLIKQESGISQPYVYISGEEPPYPIVTEIDRMMQDKMV